MTRPSFKVSQNTDMLVEYLRSAKLNTPITYKEMADHIGVKPDKLAPIIASAKRILLRDNLVFGVHTRGRSLQKLDDSGIVDNSHNDVKRISRASKRAGKKLLSVRDVTVLPPQKQMQYTINMSIVTLTGHVASGNGVKKIAQAAVSGRADQLPISELLEAFRA
jgi:hypothetical protein